MKRDDNIAGSPPLQVQGREIVERLGGVWRHGSGMCRCPAHDDHSPSLSVRLGERQLLFHCFAGCETGRVMRALNALRLLGPVVRSAVRDGCSSPADPGRRNRGAAARLWAAARPIAGSRAEAYLRARGLELDSPDLRFHPRTPAGRGPQAVFRPAMIAAVRDGSGLVAVHRTFIDPRSPGLADLPVPKCALGRLGQGAVRLRLPRNAILGMAEGIETAMAAMQLTGIACWAALGTERFARVALPQGVTRLVLFLDNDPGGRRAETLARGAYCRAGVAIEARYPEGPGSDWNDALLRGGTLR